MSSLRSRATPATKGPKNPETIPWGPPLVLTDAEAAGMALILSNPPKPNARLKAAFARHAPRRTARDDLQRRWEALRLVITTEPVATHEEPAHLISWANRKGVSVEAAHAKKRSVKAQRALGERIARLFQTTHHAVTGRIVNLSTAPFVAVHLCRVAPHELDSDNLESAFKAVRDGIATGLGINDRSPLVRYVVSQERGGVREHLVKASLHVSINAATGTEQP